ncbi:MAG: ATP:cob(I)alamin adenosyltransferase [Ruminococcaceae bacterium]|nr:ATP:cob(I)alamin adenosyltransferase [Oscillospiraceae bacterium]
MSIVTKCGDKKMTDLIGERVSKTDKRIELIGTVDEVISILSIANSFIDSKKYTEEFTICQDALYRFNGQIAGADFTELTKYTEYFEEFISSNESRNFTFNYTVTKVGSLIDYARAVIRRAERIFCNCDNKREDLCKFINRISDYLYVFSRKVDSEGL